MPSRATWWGLMLLAAAVRVAHAPLNALHHADELWQYLEPAYRLTGGAWVQTWEWREGTRSWFVPALLAGPMKLGMLIAPGSQAHVLLPRLFMVAVSLPVVHAAMRLGARLSPRHAILAGFVAAIWFEFVYFAPRTLSEPLAVALFVVAAALLFDGRERTRARLALAGLLLGSTVMVRFQFGPAVMVLAAAVLFHNLRVAWPLVAGGAAACLIAGTVDLLAGQAPFLWIWASIEQNLVSNRSAAFGVSGPFGYAWEVASAWSWAGLLLVPLAIVGARRYPVLMAAALVNLAVHSLVPHKEYRFVLLTTAIFVLLAAIASVDLVDRLARDRDARWRTRALWAVAVGWFALSAVTGALLPFKRNWGRYTALPDALAMAGRVPDACGLAIVGQPHKIAVAWTFYDRRTPILMFYGDMASADARAHSGAFNLMLAPYGTARLPDPGFRFLGCSQRIRPGRAGPDFCVWHRPGGCAAPPPATFEVNAVLERLDE